MFFHKINYTYDKGSGISIVQIYRGPTVTAVGTPQTTPNLLVSSANTSNALIYLSPTTSAYGSLRWLIGQSLSSSFVADLQFGVTLEEGYDMLITVDPNLNNTDHSFYAEWAEESTI